MTHRVGFAYWTRTGYRLSCMDVRAGTEEQAKAMVLESVRNASPTSLVVTKLSESRV